jgi:hypothetical protein
VALLGNDREVPQPPHIDSRGHAPITAPNVIGLVMIVSGTDVDIARRGGQRGRP